MSAAVPHDASDTPRSHRKPATRDLFKRFAAYYRPHRGLFVLDFGSAVVAGLLELAFPVAVTLFIDRLLPTGALGLIALAALGLLLVYALSAALHVVVTYWGHMLGIRIETEMRRKAFDHLQKLSFGYFDNQKTGHLVARLTKDLEEIGEVAHHGPEDVFIAVMTLIGAFALMLWVHVPLAILTALILPLSAFITIRYGRRMTATWRAIYGRVAEFNARIEENVGGIRVVQAFANEDHERDLFARNNAGYLKTKLDAYRVMAASSSLSYLSMRFVQVVVMVAGAWFVVRGELTAGGFVGFLLLVNVFFRPLDMINAVIETYPKGIAGFQRYVQFLDTRPDISDRPHAKAIARLNGDIEYRHVRFGYRPDKHLFEDLSFSVHAGETIAIVGPSGAGKTTICSLLPRFYEIASGAIIIDGVDIRNMTLKSLRSNIGIVQQDVFLFAGTIRENIAYGRLDAAEAEIAEAARRAQLDGVIAVLPAGLDTVIGERGVKLSGGQKQRLAIARIFLKNPPILILDEATSALDTETERAIQQSLAELSEGRTTLVIAHRLATIVNADRILVVENGRIVEDGAHAELLGRPNGRYRRLRAAQAGSAQGPAVTNAFANSTELPDREVRRKPANSGPPEPASGYALDKRKNGRMMRDARTRLIPQPFCKTARLALAALILLANASGVVRAQDQQPPQQPAVTAPREPAASASPVSPAPDTTTPGASPANSQAPTVSDPASEPLAAASPVEPTAEPSLEQPPAGTVPATLPHDLSPWGMFMQADIIVKAVMMGLAFASLVTWTVWLGKGLELVAAKRKARSATRKLQRSDSLAEATNAIDAGWTRSGPVADLVQAAARELKRSSELSAEGVKERLAIALSRIEASTGRSMTRGTGLLATIGATAPFVGLFGTVWGIMNSFIGISVAKTTNLAVVAPGIAEALLATALGLVAAIPAVIIYNVFVRAIAGYRALLSDASGEILQHLSRDLERREKIDAVHQRSEETDDHLSMRDGAGVVGRRSRAAPALRSAE